jgi:ribosomal protein L37AE/L43A
MREWTSQELATLRNQAHLGAEYVAQVLNRSVPSVKRQAQRHRISLRKPGEGRGIVLGQPRGVKWVDQVRAGVPIERLNLLREQVVSGEIDMATLERKAREAVEGKPKPTCPACSQRPVERSTTGLCEVCHWTYLARAHRDEADRAEARRRLDAARQEKSRAMRGTVVAIRRP